MNEPRQKKRRLTVPVVALLALLPLLYVASAAPVLSLFVRGRHPGPLAKSLEFETFQRIWLSCYDPVLWLANRWPLREPLSWWAKSWGVQWTWDHYASFG